MANMKTPSHIEPAQVERASGFSLVHIVIAVAILAVAALTLSAVQIQSMTLAAANRESAEARQVARQILEQVQERQPGQVFAIYNTNKLDDPGGAGSAPGRVVFSDGGITGEVLFPGFPTADLREDISDARLGMPRDLNGDGAVDSNDHSADYLLLPVRVRVTWSGVSGPRTLELHALVLNQ